MAKIIPAEEKVFMVSKSTNTTYSGSAALKAMQEWYTMEDVANSVLPYKVFTALLTQSGVSDELSQSSGSLTKGVSYQFSGTGGVSADFSNVGVTNVVDGEWFIATQTAEPINWDGWNVSFNEGAPVATVLENAIGNVWFDYQQNGAYGLNSNGLFTLEKTAIFFGPPYSDEPFQTVINVETFNATDSKYLFKVYHESYLADNYLINTPIEIRVYN